MRGWIVVNGFINSAKFNELYTFFKNSAAKKNIPLEIITTCKLATCLNDKFEKIDLPDFALFWDKDVYLAKRLENTGLPVFNSSQAIEKCDNKILTSMELTDKVDIPKTVIVPKTFDGVGYTDFQFLKTAIDILGLPLIIKEARGSFGQQVYLAKTFDQAKEILYSIGSKECLLQEFISESFGKDVRINVVGQKAEAAILRYNENDFRSNISNGGKFRKYSPQDEQIKAALSACEALGLDFAGVDVLFGKNGKPYICEVNSNPHFKTTYDCTGVDLSEKILDYVLNKIK